MKTLFYENSGGGICAVVEQEDGAIENVLSGFELNKWDVPEMWDVPDLILAARLGFPDSDPYDSSAFSGLSAEEAAKEIADHDDLIAEFDRDTFTLYPSAMGFAGKDLFKIREEG